MLRSALKAVRPRAPLHNVTRKLSQARAYVDTSLFHLPGATHLAALLSGGVFPLVERAGDGLQRSGVGVRQASLGSICRGIGVVTPPRNGPAEVPFPGCPAPRVELEQGSGKVVEQRE